MSSNKKAQKRKKRQRGAWGVAGGRGKRVAAPKSRLRSLMMVLDDMVSAAQGELFATPGVEIPLVRFDVEILLRGINGVKSIRLLLENGHWENAAAVTRQLFELLLNMEYLASLEDREEAMLRYCRFGALQIVQDEHRKVLYDQKSGRSVDQERLRQLDAMLQNAFTELQGTPKQDGTITWQPSWSGKNTKALAEASANALRLDQYEQLFRAWSVQAHATPGSLVPNMFRSADASWIKDLIASDDKKSIEAVAMTVALFTDLWWQLPGVTVLDPERAIIWMNGVKSVIDARSAGEAEDVS